MNSIFFIPVLRRWIKRGAGDGGGGVAGGVGVRIGMEREAR